MYPSKRFRVEVIAVQGNRRFWKLSKLKVKKHCKIKTSTKLNLKISFKTNENFFESNADTNPLHQREVERVKRQSHKMVKHTQTIRRQFSDEIFEYV